MKLLGYIIVGISGYLIGASVEDEKRKEEAKGWRFQLKEAEEKAKPNRNEK